MEGAFTHLGNHLISDSASTINAGDDLSTIDPDESVLDGEYGRANIPGGPRRRRHDDEDEGTEAFEDDDTESLASMQVNGMRGKVGTGAEEEKELPAHACA
jgi:regulator of nonsense transcripts 1